MSDYVSNVVRDLNVLNRPLQGVIDAGIYTMDKRGFEYTHSIYIWRAIWRE